MEEEKLVKCAGYGGKQDVRRKKESLLLLYSFIDLAAVLYNISDRIRSLGQEEL